ncbi:MAG: hypothetical protein D8B42_04185, partial [Kingella sp. (in: b-proteobacteria)]
MREYAFRFAYDSLRVSRILQSSPWSMFFGGAFFVSLFGSGLLAVDFQAALQNVNFVNVMVGIMMVMLGKTGWDMLVQGWRERQVLERLNAAPTSTWRLVEMEIKVKGSKFFGFDFGYYTKVMGNELYIEIGAGSLQPDNSWRLQVNGQSLLLAVARDDGEAV